MFLKGRWSSGYDATLTPWRSQVRSLPGPLSGPVDQLEDRHLGMVEVSGSSPDGSIYYINILKIIYEKEDIFTNNIPINYICSVSYWMVFPRCYVLYFSKTL